MALSLLLTALPASRSGLWAQRLRDCTAGIPRARHQPSAASCPPRVGHPEPPCLTAAGHPGPPVTAVCEAVSEAVSVEAQSELVGAGSLFPRGEEAAAHVALSSVPGSPCPSPALQA